MGKPAFATPPWDAVEKLYRDLRFTERIQPGTTYARDIEAAIDLLLENRISSTACRYLPRDAVRRARFLRIQAHEQHAAAAARLRDATSISAVRAASGHRSGLSEADQGESPGDDNLDALKIAPENIEDIVCTEDLADRIARTASGMNTGRPVAAILAGLRSDLSTAKIAKELCISAATVQRTVAILRMRAGRQIAAVAAA